VIAVMQKPNGAQAAGQGAFAAKLKASIVTSLIAAALTLSIGLAALGALTATTAVAAGGLGLAYGACERTEANLASDLGIGVATLRATDPATLATQVAARHTTGALTATGAQHATDRAASYATCRQVFGTTAAPEQPGDR
jgi:hypothetical protein